MTNYSAISNFISDCYQYFSYNTHPDDLASDDEVIYRLLCLAQDICDKKSGNK